MVEYVLLYPGRGELIVRQVKMFQVMKTWKIQLEKIEIVINLLLPKKLCLVRKLMRFLAKISLLSLLLLLNILLGILTILLLPRSSTLSLVSTEISSTSSSAKLLLVITSTSTLLGRLARVAQPDNTR